MDVTFFLIDKGVGGGFHDVGWVIDRDGAHGLAREVSVVMSGWEGRGGEGAGPDWGGWMDGV